MMPSLASSVLVSALLRMASDSGGSGVVVRKGNTGAGAIIVRLAQKGQFAGVWERMRTVNGALQWVRTDVHAIETESGFSAYLARRVTTDVDLWAIELDVADAPRFAGAMPCGD